MKKLFYNPKAICLVVAVTAAIFLASCALLPDLPVNQTPAPDNTQAALSTADPSATPSAVPSPSITVMQPQATVTQPWETVMVTPSDEEYTEGDEEYTEGDDEDSEWDYEDGEGDGEDYEGDGEDYEGGGSYDELSPEEQELIDAVYNPQSCGYGPLPVPKPEISDEDMAGFNPDKLPDYLINGLYDDIDGSSEICKAKLTDGKLYITVQYDVIVDADSAYKYLKSTFSLSDDEILNFVMFSDEGCSIHNGLMYTEIAWHIEDGSAMDVGEEEWLAQYEAGEVDGWAPNAVYVGLIDLPPMAVADDAAIILFDGDTYMGRRATVQEYADYLLNGNSENDEVISCYTVWFKYSGDEITGITEKFTP